MSSSGSADFRLRDEESQRELKLALASSTRHRRIPMGFWSKTFTWWNGATWGTALWTRRFGNKVGEDADGNIYYQAKKRPWRRWVIYNGSNDGSRVPPDWQLWLRGTIDDLPDKALPPVRNFQTKPTPNLTGTMERFRPDGALGSGRIRPASTGDYEPWIPE
jgi:NADH:ubiquinone oxidoreductase subunit